VGSGTVRAFTNGRLIEGTWSRATKSDRIAFTDAAGSPIKLMPGTTWVELPDASYAVDVTAAAPAPPPSS
jgi:hypothetical protein